MHQNAVYIVTLIEVVDDAEQVFRGEARFGPQHGAANAQLPASLHLVADVDCRRRVFADQDHRKARFDASGSQLLQFLCHFGLDLGRENDSIEYACAHLLCRIQAQRLPVVSKTPNWGCCASQSCWNQQPGESRHV